MLGAMGRLEASMGGVVHKLDCLENKVGQHDEVLQGLVRKVAVLERGGAPGVANAPLVPCADASVPRVPAPAFETTSRVLVLGLFPLNTRRSEVVEAASKLLGCLPSRGAG